MEKVDDSERSISEKLWGLHAVVVIPPIYAEPDTPMHQVHIERTTIALRRLRQRLEAELCIRTLQHRAQILYASENGAKICGNLVRREITGEFGASETDLLLRKNGPQQSGSAIGALLKEDKKLLFLIPDSKTRPIEIVDGLFRGTFPPGRGRALYPGQFCLFYPQARGYEYFVWNNEFSHD